MLRHLFDVRKNEAQRVALMFSLLALIIATSYILKPVRSSLFLNQFGAEQLPYVYLLVALVLGVVASGFARLVARMSLRRLFAKASLFFAINLVLFWILIGSDWRWTGFAFYIWVSIFTAVMPSLYWLLANYVFYPNEGRRLFPIMTAGGLFGSIIGAAITWLLVPITGTRFLMIAAALSLIAVSWLAARVLRQERSRIREQRENMRRQLESRSAKSGSDSVLLVIAKSRHLKLLAGLILVTSVTSTLVDYQFNLVVEQSFDDLDGLTRFFGTFFGFINIVAFALELTLAGRLLKRLGLAGGLLLLPIALGLSSLSFLLIPGLLTAAAIKTSDDGLSNSLNKSSVELLFLPLSLQVKNRVKSWLDMFVERFGRGLGGVTILAVGALSLGDHLSVIVLCLLVPWIGLALALERQYGETFRESIARREISESSIRLQDTQSLDVLRGILSTDDSRQQLHALELIHETTDPELRDRVLAMVNSKNRLVRREALLLLGRSDNPPVVPGMDRLVNDADPELAAAALSVRIASEPEEARSDFARLAEQGRTETLVQLLEQLSEAPPWLGETVPNERLVDYARSAKPMDRRLAALIGSQHQELAASMLIELMHDDSVDVARTAIAAFERLPATTDFVPLVATLSRPSLRAPAAKALSQFGVPAMDLLLDTVFDPSQSTAMRIGAVRALAYFDEPRIPNEIITRLPLPQPSIHFQAIKTLSKLRGRYDTKPASKEVDRLLAFESEQMNFLDGTRRAIVPWREESSGTGLLVDALEERIGSGREKIFRLLGLIYPSEELFNIWNRVAYGRPTVRAAAIEYLSTLLKRHHRRFVELAEDHSSDSRGDSNTRSVAVGLLENMLERKDPWLATCAAHVAGEWHARAALPSLQALARSPELMLRESARLALEKMNTTA